MGTTDRDNQLHDAIIPFTADGATENPVANFRNAALIGDDKLMPDERPGGGSALRKCMLNRSFHCRIGALNLS